MRQLATEVEMQTGDGDYFMENDPALMDPNSPEFAAIVDGSDSIEEGEAAEVTADTAKQGEESATPGAADQKADDQTQDQSETEVAGVLSPDGKHVIPYGALKAARQEASEARRAAEELQAQLEALKAQMGTKPGDEIDVDIDATQDATDDLSAKVKQLGDDFPEFGEFASKLLKQVETLTSEVTTLKAERQQQQQQQADTVRDRILEAIDSNPSLSLWRAEQPEMYDKAIAFDKVLRQEPEWAGKPYAERFAKVAELVQTTYPQAKRPNAPAPKPENKQDLDTRIDKALKDAGEYAPQSLSHIPGGEAPSANDGKYQSVTDLEAFFEKASPEQAEAYLARFG